MDQARTVDVADENKSMFSPQHNMVGSAILLKVDLDTIFFQGALHRVKGSLDDIESWQGKFGNQLSDHKGDRSLVGFMDAKLFKMQGKFDLAIVISSKFLNKIGDMDWFYKITTKVVANFLDQLQASYSGNMWFAMGAFQQAKIAYECALKFGSMLLHVATFVGWVMFL